jgi:homoaconitase/3-isopropylmalate dehydratase large subunit
MEQFFSHKVGKPVRAGGVIRLKPDHVVSHDGTTLDAVEVLKELGVGSIAPEITEKMKVFVDHSFPPATALYAEKYHLIREFCAQYGVSLFDHGEGICHSVMVEDNYVKHGDFVAGADSHTTSIGAVPGAAGTGFGGTDLGAIWVSGETWFPVPASILVTVTGRHRQGTDPLDGALHMLKLLQPIVDEVRKELEKKHRMFTLAIELTGKAIHDLSQLERMPYTTVVKEANADTCTVLPEGYEPCSENYAAMVKMDLAEVVPYVALPPEIKDAKYPYPYQVVPVEELEGKKHPINRVSIQSCTGAYDYSIVEASRVLAKSGSAVSPLVQFYVVPATRKVNERMMDSGDLPRLLKAGAIAATPSCGNCIGRGCGVLGSKDRAISTSSRNETGRMGSEQAIIYLASALTATASAINGYLTDPRSI